MLTNKDYYDLESAESKIQDVENYINLAVNFEVLKQICICKGVFTQNDFDAVKQYTVQNKEFQEMINQIKEVKEQIKFFKNHPQEYLQYIMKLKMEGKIK